MNRETRRNFVKKSLIGVAGITVGLSAKSYGRILGANDRVNFGVAGLNGRGKALVNSILGSSNTSVGFVCDVDSRVVESSRQMVKELSKTSPKGIEDIRQLVEEKDLDALAIATPDHWHAPMTLLALQAGKHVYVEKPCCHNPKEGEMAVEAQKKYGLQVQMGNQQRSGPTSIQAVQDIRDGIIGDVYFGKAWYSNKRGSIGNGKKVAVPDWLNWDLWQGPAPRETYRDNLVHYNWHWFWNWGTGEINNNGTHEIDICRWALGVDYPVSVNSAGGRYHFNDDWEFYDTQVANFEFEGGKMITWEGKSCNSFEYYQRGRGVTIHGTKGTVLLDRNGIQVYDLDGNVVKELKESELSATTDTVGIGGLDVRHMQNFVNGIREGEALTAPVADGYRSNLLCHLGNISQKFGRTLATDPKSGRIKNDDEAMKMWSRDYELGWEPSV